MVAVAEEAEAEAVSRQRVVRVVALMSVKIVAQSSAVEAAEAAEEMVLIGRLSVARAVVLAEGEPVAVAALGGDRLHNHCMHSTPQRPNPVTAFTPVYLVE